LKGEIKKKNKIHERIQKKSKEKESYLKNNNKNHNYGSNDEIEKFDKKAKH
jgi:hypothetical protein